MNYYRNLFDHPVYNRRTIQEAKQILDTFGNRIGIRNLGDKSDNVTICQCGECVTTMKQKKISLSAFSAQRSGINYDNDGSSPNLLQHDFDSLLKDCDKNGNGILNGSIETISCDKTVPCNGCKGSQSCATCAGTKLEKCSSCLGNGLCAKCSGDGEIDCIYCRGNKKCSNCQGTGKVLCARCDGTKKCCECNNSGMCSTCNGQGICLFCENGEILCQSCGGGGHERCTSCDGTGQYSVDCKYCHGLGYVERRNGTSDCRHCQGTGKYSTTCKYCNGRGDFVCKECYGSGQIPCNYCEGSKTCYKCDGKKICISCNGSKICSFCQGRGNFYCKTCNQHDGICSFCNEKGKLVCDVCHASKICQKCGGRQGFECHTCNGSGLCIDCNGAGNVICGKCEGKGVYQQFVYYQIEVDEKEIVSMSRDVLYPKNSDYKLLQIYDGPIKKWKNIDDAEDYVDAALSDIPYQVLFIRKKIQESLLELSASKYPYELRAKIQLLPITIISYTYKGTSYKLYIAGIDSQILYKEHPLPSLGDKIMRLFD